MRRIICLTLYTSKGNYSPFCACSLDFVVVLVVDSARNSISFSFYAANIVDVDLVRKQNDQIVRYKPLRQQLAIAEYNIMSPEMPLKYIYLKRYGDRKN